MSNKSNLFKKNKGEKMISIRPVCDEVFENSFWHYNIRNELTKATYEFTKRFGIDIGIRSVKKWSSVGSPELISFPHSLNYKISRVESEEVLVSKVFEYVKDFLKIPLACSKFKRKRMIQNLTGKSKRYQFYYLSSYLDRIIIDSIFEDFTAKVKKDADIVIGFTGKVFGVDSMRALGKSYDLGDPYALVGICEKPSNVILHELGHIFGAKDIEDNNIVSVMNSSYGLETYIFDIENSKRIAKNLNRFSDE